jgi:single-strand DNA-binding protein
MLNSVIIQGKITSRGVDSVTAGETDIFKFSINYSEKYKDEWKNSFFECVAFGKTGAMVQNYFEAGSAITLEGKLQQEQWKDKDGNNRSKVSIVVNRVHFNMRDSEKKDESQEQKEIKSKEEFSSGIPDVGGDVPF